MKIGEPMDEIEAPVPMPPVVRRIATLMIGLPGAVIWLGGLFATMVSTVFLFVMRPDGLSILAILGGSLAAVLIGYTMMSATSWLNGAYHYRMPGHRLPAFVAWEILDQLLAALSVGFLIVSLISLASGEPPLPWLWLLLAAVGFILVGLNMRVRRKWGYTWREELWESPEGTEPPT
jgi:hypothetical protein